MIIAFKKKKKINRMRRKKSNNNILALFLEKHEVKLIWPFMFIGFMIPVSRQLIFKKKNKIERNFNDH